MHSARRYENEDYNNRDDLYATILDQSLNRNDVVAKRWTA